jgi:hypothetical protein
MTVECVPDPEFLVAKATMINKHLGKMLGFNVVLDVVLGLVVEAGTEAAAPDPLLRLCRPANDILVEMFRAAVHR